VCVCVCVCFQAALLYTDIYGQRKLRIHNLAMGCSTKFLDVYRCCEMDTIISFFSKSSKSFTWGRQCLPF